MVTTRFPSAERVVHHHPGVPEAPDPDLGEAPHVGHPRDVPERVAVRQLEPVDERQVVEVRVEVDDVERLGVRADDRVRDAVVAAEHDRQRAPLEEPPRHRGHVVEGPGHVGGQDVRVARVDDAAVGELVAQELPPERRVVVPLAPRPEAHRVLPDAARAEPGARHERRPLVARDAHHGDVGVEPVEVGGDDGAEEGRDADERGVPARPGRGWHGAPLRRRRGPAHARRRARPPPGRSRAARAPSRSRGAPPRSTRPAARPGIPPPIPIIAHAALSAGSQCPISWIAQRSRIAAWIRVHVAASPRLAARRSSTKSAGTTLASPGTRPSPPSRRLAAARCSWPWSTRKSARAALTARNAWKATKSPAESLIPSTRPSRASAVHRARAPAPGACTAGCCRGAPAGPPASITVSMWRRWAAPSTPK